MTQFAAKNNSGALRLEGLTASFGDRRVVDQVDLRVPHGEILTLVGPSGCGKSTLARLVAGLMRPDHGRVLVGDVDITDVAPERRRIGLVFQDASLFGHLRVGDNVGFGLRDLTRRERERRVAEMLEVVGLAGHAARHPHELSGGEQQRVALARALAPRPHVLLLDEPFANLDEVLRDGLRRQVAEILRSAGTTSILVTHDRNEAMSLGDTVAVMGDGRIVQCDTPQAVYQSPANRFVASFMGDATFIAVAEGSVAVARPSDVSLERGGEDRIVRVEFLGARTRYEIRRRDGSVVIAEGDSREEFALGERCTVHVDLLRLRRIDAESTR